MHVHASDPAYLQSEQSRARFRLAAQVASGFVAALWVFHLLNSALDLGPGPFGIRPREVPGLLGIVFAPLMHASFEHLISNSPPLIVLGTAMLFLYPGASIVVLPWIYFGPGVAVWLLGRDAVHLGASGLVYGLFAYVLIGGILRRDRRAVAASLIACFLYGSMVWGVLPIRVGTSWETHLAAAVLATLLAIVLRHRDVPPRRRYAWEGEADAESRETELKVPGDAADRPTLH